MFSISSSSSNSDNKIDKKGFSSYNEPKKFQKGSKLLKANNYESSENEEESKSIIYKSTSMLSSKIDFLNKHLEKKIMHTKKKQIESPGSGSLHSDIDEIPSFFKVKSTLQAKKNESLFDST